MTRRALWTLLLLFLVGATTAFASEQSERLYSRGLVEFHASRYNEALALFEQAVSADPSDLYARYYRGVTHGRLGQYSPAVDDLRAVVTQQPGLDQAAVELGVALVQSGQYAEAVPLLQRAQRVPESEATASLFLGIAQLRLGQRSDARTQLARAAAHDPQLEVPALYYQGVVDYLERDWDDARTHFGAVVEKSPDSEMGREAQLLLDRLGTAAAPVLQLYGETGFQYDSNVVLAPSDDALKSAAGISRQADGRAIIAAGGTYVPWRTEHTQLSVGYEFYQSLHFNLSSFDLQDHRPHAELLSQFGSVQVGLLGYYDYYLIDRAPHSFLQSVTGFPWVEVETPGGWGRTQLSLRVRGRDFYEQPFKDLRNSTNYAPGVRQLLPLGGPDRYALLGYQFDREDPQRHTGSAFGYDGNQAVAGVGWVLPFQLHSELVYAYRREDYDAASDGRHDNEQRLTFIMERPFTEHLSLLLGYFGTFNGSNKGAFAYDRQIGSVTLRGRL